MADDPPFPELPPEGEVPTVYEPQRGKGFGGHNGGPQPGAGRPADERDERGNTFRDCLRRQCLSPATQKFYVSPHASRLDIQAMRLCREGMAGNLKALKLIAHILDGPPRSIVTIQPAGAPTDEQESVSVTMGWVREQLGIGAQEPPKKPVH